MMSCSQHRGRIRKSADTLDSLIHRSFRVEEDQYLQGAARQGHLYLELLQVHL